jgi:hypothetical protein
MTINNDHKSSLLARLAGRWHLRLNRSSSVAGHIESAERPASQAKPRVLAGKWPGPAYPLGQRLEQLKRREIETG